MILTHTENYVFFTTGKSGKLKKIILHPTSDSKSKFTVMDAVKNIESGLKRKTRLSGAWHKTKVEIKGGVQVHTIIDTGEL